jgi:carbamoyltransferase
MQKRMNLKIKFREGFRPFAPSVLEEDIKEYFNIEIPSPYMLFVIPVAEKRRNPIPDDYFKRPLYDRLYHERSDIPAVTHIDYSARIQSVSKKTNLKYWTVINEFKKLTGYGVIVNTSFNVRGEPIVASPTDAFSCFMRTEMDYLVMGSYLIDKNEMNNIDKSRFTVEFGLD